MKVKYVGSAPAISVAGPFQPNEVREVPDDVAELLLDSYGFEKFEEEAPKTERNPKTKTEEESS